MSEINPFRTNPNYTCVYLVCPLFFICTHHAICFCVYGIFVLYK